MKTQEQIGVGARVRVEGHRKLATVTKVAVWADCVMLDVRFDGESLDRCVNAARVTVEGR